MKTILIGLLLIPLCVSAQPAGGFAPQAGLSGSTAIIKSDSSFRDWAITCEVVRGYKQIDLPDSGLATSGNPLYATGYPDAPAVVSLGDGGQATLTFNGSFHDGPGADFAVFENGFGNGEDSFLELAFVEVSSDGVFFSRFAAISELQDSVQIASFENTDASYFHNLAGKYIAGYGVPFDLSELPDTSALDKSHITHVRIIDVVGSINPLLGSQDSKGAIINDPWPTNFPQSGFDLDAVGIIHTNIPVGTSSLSADTRMSNSMRCYDLTGKLVNCNTLGIPIIVEGANGNIVKRYLVE
ncbi:MAG: T9SS C-terminal target domain-containing protein [Flavobacteriales bacterium]